MTTSYKFGGGSDRIAPSDVLDPGDYSFVVTSCNEPYQKENGNWVCSVGLSILPSGLKLLDWPWSGKTSDGKKRDGIGDFLLSCNRAPGKGDDPNWSKVIGAKGKCRLKIEGDFNKISFYHKPKQVGPMAEQEFSKEEFAQARKEATAKAGAPDEFEPEDIPF